MESALVRQFLDFFQDFLHLCQSENWPNNDTTENEIRNACLVAQHIEKCLDRLQKKNTLHEFLSSVNSNQNVPNAFLKSCFANPPKYILKKIINSKTKITQMDAGFKCFLQIFNEEKLEHCLTDLMLEAASKETLLQNLTLKIPREKILQFKSQLFLSELNNCENPKELFMELFDNCTQDTVELILVSIVNTNVEYHKSVKTIVNVLLEILRTKKYTHKKFWKFVFSIQEEHFLQICLKHGDFFRVIVKALMDSAMLLREQMTADYFYIDMSYSELVRNVQTIFKNDNLKLEFLDIVRESESDLSFWENVVL